MASTVSSLGRQNPSAQEQQVDLVLLLLDRLACFIHALQACSVAFDKADLSVGVDLTELLDDLGSLCLVSPDEVDSRREGVLHKCPGGCLADSTGPTNLKHPCQRARVNKRRAGHLSEMVVGNVPKTATRSGP